MKNKKIAMKTLSAIGTLSAIVAPIAVAVSCGSAKKVAKNAGLKTIPTGTIPTGTIPTGTIPTGTIPTGTIPTGTTPQATVKGEGQKSVQTESTHKYNKDVVVSSAPKEISKTFGDGNFANPSVTYKMTQRNLMENKTRKATGQPFSLHYHMDDVAQWTAGKDADDAFNVATVPLHNRELAGKILASQKDKQLQILGSLSKNTSQTETGTTFKDNVNDAVFQMWSKVTSFVGWGGSASEGNFVVPKGNDINAAHRNGVPLLGTLFLPADGDGGNSKDYDDLSKKVNGTYPVADKMVEMASHFGFDGWFLNFETYNRGKGDIKGFLKYFHDKMASKKLFTVLYDFGEGGQFMNDKNDSPFDEAALDYSSWKSTYAVDEKRKSYGYNYDVNEMNFKRDDFDDKNLWLYTYFKRHDIENGDDVDIQTFSDKDGSRDPRAHAGDSSYSSWTGLSKFFEAHTTINSRDGFSTSFETGIGSKFFINGEEQKLGAQLSSGGWRNQGIQDVLPTYTWINDEYNSDTTFDDSTRISKPGEAIINDGSTWKSQIEETQAAYYGSSTLHYTGKITSGNTMVSRLYGSDVSLKTDDEFSIVVQGNEAKPNLALWLQDKYDTSKVQEHVSEVIKPTNTEDIGHGMNKLTYKISSKLDGKVMSSFGIAFTNTDSKSQDADFCVGQLSFTPIETNEAVSNKITSVTPDGDFSFGGARNVRINWKMENDATVDHYIIWSTNQKIKDDFTKKDILTMSSLPAAYLQDVATEKDLNIIIDAVDSNNNIISSNKTVVRTTFDFGDMSDKTKWTEEFSRQKGKDASYTIPTGNGYTTSFKDSDGNLYFGDDYTRIHKISSDGTLKTSGTDSWGKFVSKDYKDKKTQQIFEYDKENIGVLMEDGLIHILNKETGEQTQPVIDILKTYIMKIKAYKVETVKFFSMKNGIITIFGTGFKGAIINARMSTNGISEEIVNQSGNKAISISKITVNSDKTVTMAFTQEGKIGVHEFASVNNIDLTKLTTTSEIQDSVKTFVETNFVRGIGDLAKNTPASELEEVEKGSIIMTHKLANGDTLIVNSWGIAMTVGKDGKVKATTSTVSTKTFKEFATSASQLHRDHGDQGFPGSKVTSLSAVVDGISSIISGELSFDEKTNSLQEFVKYNIDFKYAEHAEFEAKPTTVNLTDLIAGKTSDSAPILLEKEFSTEDDKKIGGIRFVNKVGDVVIIGGSESKIAIFDFNFNQLAMGQKEYLFDGKVVSSIQEIYDDKDQTIPEEFMD